MPAGLASLKLAGAVATLAAAFGLASLVRIDPPPPRAVPEPRAAQRSAALAQAVPDDAARSAAELIVPVVGVRPDELVDTFTQARASGARRHDAIDILAPRGTPVIAAAPGTVEKLFLSRDGGNTVYVRSHDGRRRYYYAHLDRYAPGLAEGMRLRQGAPIGEVGSTGNADPSAPHLHFAVWMTSPGSRWWDEALALNPYPLLRGR